MSAESIAEPGASLLGLPNELILNIAGQLHGTAAIHAFSKANRRLYLLLHDQVYRYNIQHDGATILFFAARWGKVPLAKHLLDLQRRFPTSDRYIWPRAMHAAIAVGHIDVVDLLMREEPVRQGLLRQPTPEGFMPLAYAARWQQGAMLKHLVANLPTINTDDLDLAYFCTVIQRNITLRSMLPRRARPDIWRSESPSEDGT